MNGKHYYAKIFSNVEEICTSKVFEIPETDTYLVNSLQLMLEHLLKTGRSITVLMESEFVGQAAVLMRTLFETAIRFHYIVSEKQHFNERMNYYLANKEYLNKYVSDLRIIFKENIDKVKDFEKLLTTDHSEEMAALGICEDSLVKEPAFIKKIEAYGFREHYLLYYRKFSQYVHGNFHIVSIKFDERDYKSLINDIYVCGCFCWTLIFGALNNFCNLNMIKKYKAMEKDFRKIFKFYLPK
ncbi:hypothetical protein FZC83_01735 [Rossellomorea marisflavi]|uniref:Uncharacterized protein n=1 Tax=Rossellomorea marisflavi TaxID=189381 RepID=A0A5D4S3I1_9BACI|nr:DUF5677 domain-containing protein [Rossellomorea marisflavi]TYS56316.1 hypothetical protein FZC83_01735 [Rossellomorea marisflavi]